VDRNHGVNEGKLVFDTKAKFRRAIEDEGIPHTYVVANFFTRHFLPTQSQLIDTTFPLDSVIILGDGNTKGKKHKYPSWLEVYLSHTPFTFKYRAC